MRINALMAEADRLRAKGVDARAPRLIKLTRLIAKLQREALQLGLFE